MGKLLLQFFAWLLENDVSSLYHSSMYVHTCVCVPVPPEFRSEQLRQVQVEEGDVAAVPLLLSANPEEVSCVWQRGRATLVKGELPPPPPCDGSIKQLLVELSQQSKALSAAIQAP